MHESAVKYRVLVTGDGVTPPFYSRLLNRFKDDVTGFSSTSDIFFMAVS
jgi:hypothetical protein